MRRSREIAFHWAASWLQSLGSKWPRSLDDAVTENRKCEMRAYTPSQAWQAEGEAFSLLQMACDRIKRLLRLVGSLWTLWLWVGPRTRGTFLPSQTRGLWRHLSLLGDSNESCLFWKHRERYFHATPYFRFLAVVYIPFKKLLYFLNLAKFSWLGCICFSSFPSVTSAVLT